MKNLLPFICITSLFLSGCFQENTNSVTGLCKDGKREGEWKKYHDNGKLKSIGSYKDGKRDGEWKWYYENGKLEKIGVFKNGNQQDALTYYDETGRPEDLGAMIAAGEKIHKSQCSVCHSIDGSRKIGSTFKGIWGRKVKLVGGMIKQTDYEYLLSSIKMPHQDIVEGYPPAMPRLPLTDVQIDQVIAYMKTIK